MGQNAPQPQMEGFAVTCPLAPDASRLISGFSPSRGDRGVHRPAVSDWTSFRPRLAATPLPFSLPSALRKPGHRTFTYEVTCHARHTRPASGARRLRRVALETAVRRRFTEARLFVDHIRLNLRHSFAGRVLFRVRSTTLNDPRISDPRFWRVGPTTLPNLERPRITEIEDVVQLQAAERVYITELYPRVCALGLVPIL